MLRVHKTDVASRTLVAQTAVRQLLFLSVLCTVLAGCAVNESYVGDTTYQTKKNILSSPLFVFSDIFFPDGMRENLNELPAVRDIDIDKVEEAQRYLQRLLNQIIQRHNQRREKLNQYVSSPLSLVTSSHIVLSNTGHPLIHMEANNELSVFRKVSLIFL